MEIRPILNALMRNKTGLILIALQIAITLAIVCNSVFIILQRIDKVNRPSGLDDNNIFTISSLGFAPNFDLKGTIRQDLDALRALPGVIDATTTDAVPLSNGGWGEGFSDGPQKVPEAQRKNAGGAVYMTDEHGVNAFGLRIVQGRDFNASEVSIRTKDDSGHPTSVIMSKALADKLFPNGALGKTLYSGISGTDTATTVVGIVERLQEPWVNSQEVENAVIFPQVQIGEYDAGSSRYIVRTKPGQRDAAMAAAQKKLGEINKGRIVRDPKSLQEIRGQTYRQDRAMTVVLGTVIVALMTITGLGIVGIVSFWVTRRIKQIGTRRAIGARRFDIRRYFMVENVMVVGFGVVIGVVLTYAFNLWLMQHYELPRLDWFYAPLGAVLVMLLGQLAVFGPATRAAKVSPAVATRTV